MERNKKLNVKIKVSSDYEPDSSPEAWLHYDLIYSKNAFETIYSSFTKERAGYRITRQLSKECMINEEKILDNNFKIAGDCDFNFKSTGHYTGKYERLKKIIKTGTTDIEIIMEKLKKCRDNHHSLINFSIMPATGAMNNTKARLYVSQLVGVNYSGTNHKGALDRLDTFIYCLDQYYQKKNNLVFSNCTEENEISLRNFLGLFEDVYDYCKKMYFIGGTVFVDKLIKNGEIPIQTVDDVNRYLDLALAYWAEKEKEINEVLRKYPNTINKGAQPLCQP